MADDSSDVVQVGPRIGRGIIVVLAAVALLGFVATRTRSSTEAARPAADEPTTNGLEAESPTTVSLSLETTTTTTQPGRTTTTTTAVLEVDRPDVLSEHPTEAVVVLGGYSSRKLHVVDIDAGDVRTVEYIDLGLIGSLQSFEQAGSRLVIGTDQGIYLLDEELTEAALVTTGWQVFGDETGFWVLGDDFNSDGQMVSRFGFDGQRASDVALPPNVWPVAVGNGRLLVASFAGIYAHEDGSFQRIVVGEFIGASDAGHLIYRQCDDQLRCSTIVASPDGSQTVLAVPEGVALQQWPQAAFSPDGTRVLLGALRGGRAPVFYIADLSTGVTDVALFDDVRFSGNEIVWSPNGEWLLTANDRLITAVHLETGERVEIRISGISRGLEHIGVVGRSSAAFV